jgi:hypothetical protein
MQVFSSLDLEITWPKFFCKPQNDWLNHVKSQLFLVKTPLLLVNFLFFLVKMTFLLLRPVFPLNVFFFQPSFFADRIRKNPSFFAGFPNCLVFFCLVNSEKLAGAALVRSHSSPCLPRCGDFPMGIKNNTNPGLALDNDRGPIYEGKYH